MKPWNERSGRIWEGSESIVEAGLARGLENARDRIGGGDGNQGKAPAESALSCQAALLRASISRHRQVFRIKRKSARPVRAGDGITPERRNLVGARGFR